MSSSSGPAGEAEALRTVLFSTGRFLLPFAIAKRKYKHLKIFLHQYMHINLHAECNKIVGIEKNVIKTITINKVNCMGFIGRYNAAFPSVH